MKIKEIGNLEIQKIEIQTPIETLFRVYDKIDYGEHILVATQVNSFP